MQPASPNPYQPPAAPVDVPVELPPQAHGADASRDHRFLASLIDGVLALLVLTPLQYWAGVFDDVPKVDEATLLEYGAWWLVTPAVWIATHGVSLARSAQTVGKKVFDLQVVNVSDGRPASFATLVFVRYLPTIVVSMIPMVGGLLTLVNISFIFRSDRRCLHDHIAKTRVITLRAQ